MPKAPDIRDIPASWRMRPTTPLSSAIFQLMVGWRATMLRQDGFKDFQRGLIGLAPLVVGQYNDNPLKVLIRQVRDEYRSFSSSGKNPDELYELIVRMMERADQLEAEVIKNNPGLTLSLTREAALYLRAAVKARGYKMGEYAQECYKKGWKILQDHSKQPGCWKHSKELRRVGRVLKDCWTLGQGDDVDMVLTEAIEALERLKS